MQNIKLSFTKGKATIVLDGKLYSFEIGSEEVAKLKDYVINYYNKPIDFYLSRIRAIVNRCTKVKSTKKNYVAKIEKIKLVTELEGLIIKIDDLHYFKNSEYFNVINKEVFLKNTNFKLPEDYLKLILSKQNEDLTPYINFMYDLSNNTEEKIRNKALVWLNQAGFKITENGYIYCVRWVWKVSEISELTKFYNAEYVKRKLQKKSPKNYIVYSDENCNYHSTDNKGKACLGNNLILGNLNDLYLSKPKEELKFTDNYTRKMDIRYHDIVQLDKKDCDFSDNTCSKGLHGYNFNYALDCSFGDTLIGVLVKPSDLVSLPYTDGSKFRCCKYYVQDILNESVLEEMKLSDMVISDVDYESINLDEILKSLKEKTNLYKTNSDKQKAIKDKIKSLKVNKPEEVIIDFNRIITL